MKKKSLWFVLAAVLVLGWLLMPAWTDCGASELYTLPEREAAARMIRETVAQWEGCRLYRIAYAGDDRCRRELDYCRSLSEECEECIAFDIWFRSPVFGGGAWNANQIYRWSWYLGRPEGGGWEHLTWGAA